VTDVLRRPDPDDARETEIDVDLDDRAHRGHGKGDVRALARDLPRLGIEREGAGVSVDALDVHLGSAVALTLLECRSARDLHGACGHPGHARG
jgi:hypothetical protein